MEQHDWEVVAEFTGTSMDVLAGIAVSHLRSEGIDAIRMPAENPSVVFSGASCIPIKIYVPLDQAESARELLEDIEEAETQ